jgi:DNA-binding transcriptional regulator YhcF (GntR family)
VAQVATSTLDLGVNRDSELPVTAQLAWKLRAMIAGGGLRQGERLPSVRELATLAAVNVNTARAVYRRLESDGFIVSRHGLGTFVAGRPASDSEVERIAAEAVVDARGAGLDPRDLATAIYAAADRRPDEPELPSRISSTPLPDITRESDRRDVRRELRRQIARLEAELSAYAGNERGESGTHPLLRPKAHVAGVEELEETRNKLVDRLAELRAADERRGRDREQARAHLEEMVRDPAAHRWQWVSNDDVDEPGCKTWHSRPRYGLIGMVMGWWRVKVSSGCPLAGPREAVPTERWRDRAVVSENRKG